LPTLFPDPKAAYPRSGRIAIQWLLPLKSHPSTGLLHSVKTGPETTIFLRTVRTKHLNRRRILARRTLEVNLLAAQS